MRLPFVSRGLHDAVQRDLMQMGKLYYEERARSDRLLEQLLALRREGFTPQKAGAVIAPPDPEANAQRRAADEWIDNYVADATAHGATREQALEAARQLRAELDQEHIPLES